ncbi:MAG: glycosyltransferase family 8 protein [Clostridia bacterium]|nr:glycosyltransferase family 8 protein [Clostridia bacterium]
MNILVTIDSNYVMPLSVMLYSLMQSNPDKSFDIFVAHSSLTDSDFEKIRSAVDRTRTRIHSVTVPPELLCNAPVLKRITKETYYRLLAIDFLPQEVDKVLYIDPDTLIINDITDFYNTDMSNSLITATSHVHGSLRSINLLRLGMPKSAEYINAGVMLMNLALMRKEITTSAIFEFIRRHSKTLFLGDQDVVNALYCKKTIVLDSVLFNCDEKTCRQNSLTVQQVRAKTSIIHYNGKYKPWNPDYKGILDEIWHEYAASLQRGNKNEV